MAYTRDALLQTARENCGNYLKPSNFVVDIQVKSLRELNNLECDRLVLDYDHVLSSTTRGVPEDFLSSAIRKLASKSDVFSLYSLEEMRMVAAHLARKGADNMPVNKLVLLDGLDNPYLLRIVDGGMRVWKYNPDRRSFHDSTFGLVQCGELNHNIRYNFEKPNPLLVQVITDLNKQQGRLPQKDPHIIVAGDTYLLDMVMGNLAKKLLGEEATIESALVRQFPMTSDIDARVTSLRKCDSRVGHVMRKLTF